ncbi:hypothetical protein N7456_010380 [Penicillium angulare]|uniref:RING-type E3 ubiquitin transferase n=1 Tax=Penicillium angulare TaxID=116970 RepID=A0A9W9F6Q8_9EURO|nr:hypothetical protein N7456_010380 [Penicillium angulare]
MRPPRLLLVLFCLIFFPIFVTFFSALSSSNVASPDTLGGPASGLHALFSFNIPTSLFPPSAIISLTDDNSTFFLARPAAFGPLLPGKGLSGQLWVGSGFGEGGLTAGVEGELGCSDIPGWGEGSGHKQPDILPRVTEQKAGKPGSGTTKEGNVLQNSRSQIQPDSRQNEKGDTAVSHSSSDGTDDHLHHPLSESSASEVGTSQKTGDYVQSKQSTHADIQSLQETAEIQGKVALLSRGGCGFLEKVKWAQRRGAVALIVGDDTRGGSLVTMYARGDTSNVTIPALFTSHTTAHLLSSLVPAHAGSTAGLDETIKALAANLAGQLNVDTKKATTTTTAAASSTPSFTRASSSKERPTTAVKSGGGFFRTLGSIFGLCNKFGGSSTEDSRRPPSSGNIDWMTGDITEAQVERSKGPLAFGSRDQGKSNDIPIGNKPGLVADSFEADSFVIGVQDWRDPDLMPPRSSDLLTHTTYTTGKDASKTFSPELDAISSNALQGGSITPGSGEYQSIDKNTGKSHDTIMKDSEKDIHKNTQKSESSGHGWFSSHFGWSDDAKPNVEPSASPSVQNVVTNQKSSNAAPSSHPATMFTDHEGLWVTLTPTSMSTSPFFDTLLVLVISPLLTLTVVYALLLLRSRMRRRRWRAPKSVVERLPVRTYHTISASSSSSSSPRPCSPGAALPTSPLLSSERRPSASRLSRSRSQTIAGAIPEEKHTNIQSGSTLWRRKYTGRQVECVVCLEEYIDGQSRVMSLPCGHEFHAECITPWLTTRRRTCPICKGDVVRSMAHSQGGDNQNQNEQSDALDNTEVASSEDASSAPLLIAGINDDPSDIENHPGPLDGRSTSAPARQSSWRNLASLSLSALSGDTIWHQARADRNR